MNRRTSHSIGKIRASKGTTFVLSEKDRSGNVIGQVGGVVGENGVKENTWYECKNSNLSEISF